MCVCLNYTGLDTVAAVVFRVASGTARISIAIALAPAFLVAMRLHLPLQVLRELLLLLSVCMLLVSMPTAVNLVLAAR